MILVCIVAGWFGWVLWHINHYCLFNTKSCLYIYIRYICMICKHILEIFLNELEFFLHTVKWFKVLLCNSHNLTSVICLHTVFSIWPIDRTLSDATTPDQSGPWSDCNKGLIRIPLCSNITGASPSDCLMSYPGHPLGVLSICWDPIGVFYSPSRFVYMYMCVLSLFLSPYIHHHVMLPAQISLTLSRHQSLSSIAPGRSSRLHPVSAQSCCI